MAGVDSANQAGIYRPGHGLPGKAGDGALIRVTGQRRGRGAVTQIARVVAVEDGGNLFPGNGLFRQEFMVANALYNPVLGSPGNGLGIERAIRHIGESGSAIHGGRTVQAVQHRHYLCPGGRGVGCKFCGRDAIHQTGFVDVHHLIVKPTAGRYVAKRKGRGTGAVGFRPLGSVCKASFLNLGGEGPSFCFDAVPGGGDDGIFFRRGDRRSRLGRQDCKCGNGHGNQKKNRQNAFHGSSPFRDVPENSCQNCNKL